MQTLTQKESFETHRILGEIHKTLQEYMHNFMLVGYASDGSPVVMEFAPTEMDSSALIKLTENLLMIREEQTSAELAEALQNRNQE